MKQSFIACCVGILFGTGLALSQMTNPDKVIAFLDITGNWDPSLAFVMLGALSVAIPGFYFIRKRSRPLITKQFHFTNKTTLDKPLIWGATFFGIGWGMSGYCPGSAIAGLGLGYSDALLMVLSIYAGFFCQHAFFKQS